MLQCAMTERQPPKQPPKQPNPSARSAKDHQARVEREAAALRENLLRRKQQARARADAKPDKPKT
jgi:hypothetical protein